MKLPYGWKRVPLEQVAEVRSGVAKGKTGLKDPVSLPYLRVANVQDGYLDLNDVKEIEIERDKIKRYSLMFGDVLMNEGGDFDKLGRGDVWLGQIDPCLHQNHVFAVRPNAKTIDSFFLASLAASNYGKNYFLSCAKRSTNLASINSTQIKEFPTLVPPLAEQKKIAQILSTWDQAINVTEQLLTNSQQQKKALMQQLLTGKKRLLDENGVRFSGEWTFYTLSSMAHIVMGSSPKSEAYNEDRVGLPLLQGNADIKNRRSVPRVFTSEITKECEIGDILLSVRAPVGAIALSEHKACIGRGIAALKAKPTFYQGFIYQWLLWFEPRWLSLSQGSTFESINSEDIKNLRIRAPEIAEQQKIAAVLSTADDEITVLQQKLTALKQEKKALMQQLLTGKRRVIVDDVSDN